MKNETSTAGAVITLDPRTEELLREIAAQPGACVLRASRRELDEALTRSDYRGLDTRVGFSAAERELMRTARFELAYWINVLCYRRLTEDEETRRYYTRLGAGDREFVPPSTEDIASGACAALAAAGELRVDEMSTAEVLLSTVASLEAQSGARRPSVLALAAASLRLQPTFQARHYALQARVVECSGHVIEAPLRALVAGSASRAEAAFARALSGTAAWLRSSPADALSRYASAAELLPEVSEFAFRAYAMSIYIHDITAARLWGPVVDRTRSATSVAGTVARSVRASPWTRRPEVQEFAKLLRAESGTATTELLDVFAKV